MCIKLREIRKSKNISVIELSKAINKSTKSYYKREAGTVKFTLSEIKIISELVNMPVEEIFFTDKLSIVESRAV